MPQQTDSTGLPDLEAALMREFERLGVDPNKVAAQVASGNENAVFDLSASINDPDGEGPEPPESITLSWTERHIGDYDQNGFVNISDITPLGIHFKSSVAYDAPELHGGLKYWPQGDPDNAGSANWRKARVDGDDNGQINISDITPIALHWNEQLSGYRVYLEAPGGGGFGLLPDPENAGSSLSCPRSKLSLDPNEPVRYSFTLPTPENGIYRLYLKGYDAASDTEGPASSIISIDTGTGVINQSPMAKLTVTPDFAGAPAEITLDAAASLDLDGTISAYEWDFDGDGTVDWTSTDPLPETSSNGTVTDIASPAPGKVTATYTQGSADYYFPMVTVSDDMSATSEAASDRLGISGWVDSEFIWSEEDTPFSFKPDHYFYNDVAQQPCCTGTPSGNRTLYYAQRTGVEQWQEEVVFDTNHPLIHEFTGDLGIVFNFGYAAFKDNGQPTIVIFLAWGTLNWNSAIFISDRSPSGVWTTELLHESPSGFNKPAPIAPAPIVKTGPNSFHILVGESYGTQPESGAGSRNFVINYSNGVASIENGSHIDTYFNDALVQLPQRIVQGGDGKTYIPIQYVEWDDPRPEVRYLRRDGPENYVLEIVDCSELPNVGDYFGFNAMSSDANEGKLYLMSDQNDSGPDLILISEAPQSLTVMSIPITQILAAFPHPDLFHVDESHLLITTLYSSSQLPSELKSFAQSFLVENNSIVIEDVFRVFEDSEAERYPVQIDLISKISGLGLSSIITEYGDGGRGGALILRRLDPRESL